MTTLDFLLGRWSIDRLIFDCRSGTSPIFTGEALVSRLGPAEARYDEWGIFTEGDAYRSRAQRSLIYRPESSSVRVHFPDGRPFHDLDLTGGAWEVEHGCGADVYRITFLVGDADTLIERWRVRGPRKAYEAETFWRRAMTPAIRSAPGTTLLGGRVVDEEQA